MIGNIGKSEQGFAALLAPLAAGLYAWLAAVSFGLAWLDIVYARLVRAAAFAFPETADFLLLVAGLTILAGLAALAPAWRCAAARNLIGASLAVNFLGLFAAVTLSQSLPQGSAFGAGLRLVLAGSISALALIGFYKLRSRGQTM